MPSTCVTSSAAPPPPPPPPLPPIAPQSWVNRQGYPSAKENIIPLLRKPRQVKCGLIWRSDTTFACELHNCYGLRELKPLNSYHMTNLSLFIWARNGDKFPEPVRFWRNRRFISAVPWDFRSDQSEKWGLIQHRPLTLGVLALCFPETPGMKTAGCSWSSSPSVLFYLCQYCQELVSLSNCIFIFSSDSFESLFLTKCVSYCFRLPGIHQQHSFLLHALLCSCGKFYYPPPLSKLYFSLRQHSHIYLFWCFQIVVKKWAIPCPLPHNLTTLSGGFQVTANPISFPAYLHKHTYMRYPRSEVGSLEQTVTATGLGGKTQRIELTDWVRSGWWGPEDLVQLSTRWLMPVLRGRKCRWPRPEPGSELWPIEIIQPVL